MAIGKQPEWKLGNIKIKTTIPWGDVDINLSHETIESLLVLVLRPKGIKEHSVSPKLWNKERMSHRPKGVLTPDLPYRWIF